jgi:APA family basic amino acid/polyamine antiporter
MTGFSLPLNLGEEIKNPVKNIPRSIALSTLIGMVLMTGLIVVAVGALHWSEWAGAEAGIAVVAREFLPWWGVFLIALAAIVGALTTVNAVFVNTSRIVMRAARDEVIPKSLARVNERWDSPDAAILALGVPALLIVPFAPGLLDLAFILALSFLMDMLFLALASFQLTRRFPMRYEHSTYRIPKPILYILVAIGALIPLGLWVLMAMGEGSGLILAVAVPVWLGLGYIVYRYRVYTYQKKGIDLRDEMRRLHKHEEEMASDFEKAVGGDD